MNITTKEYKLIEHLLPKQRGNVKVPNIKVLNAFLYITEQGCKWRAVPKHFGPWHTLYTRMNRWAKQGVLEDIFFAVQEADSVSIQVDQISLDSTYVKVHPDGTGALKKRPSVHR